MSHKGLFINTCLFCPCAPQSNNRICWCPRMSNFPSFESTSDVNMKRGMVSTPQKTNTWPLIGCKNHFQWLKHLNMFFKHHHPRIEPRTSTVEYVCEAQAPVVTICQGLVGVEQLVCAVPENFDGWVLARLFPKNLVNTWRVELFFLGDNTKGTPWKFNSSPLKMDSWKTALLLGSCWKNRMIWYSGSKHLKIGDGHPTLNRKSLQQKHPGVDPAQSHIGIFWAFFSEFSVTRVGFSELWAFSEPGSGSNSLTTSQKYICPYKVGVSSRSDPINAEKNHYKWPKIDR